MKTKIEFDAITPINDHSSMVWHYGSVTQGKKKYDFTLCEMYDSNSGTSSYEVTWMDETPPNFSENLPAKLDEIRNANDQLDALEMALSLLKEATGFIDAIKFDEGEEVDVGGDESLEGRINIFLKSQGK